MFNFITKNNLGNSADSKTATKAGALEQNSRNDELKGAVQTSGQTLSDYSDQNDPNTTQLAKALGVYGRGAQSMQDNGTANTVQLTPITGDDGLQIPNLSDGGYDLMDGAIISFIPSTENTGNVTISIGQTTSSQLGSKKALNIDGSELASGTLSTSLFSNFVYSSSADSGNGAFILKSTAADTQVNAPIARTVITTSGTHTIGASTSFFDVFMWGAGGGGALESGVNDSGGAGSGAYGHIRVPATPSEVLTVTIGAGGAQGTTVPGNAGGDTTVTGPTSGTIGTAGGGGGGANPIGAGGTWTQGDYVPVFATDGANGINRSVELVDSTTNFYHQGGPAFGFGGLFAARNAGLSGTDSTCYGMGGPSSDIALFTTGMQGIVIITEY